MNHRTVAAIALLLFLGGCHHEDVDQGPSIAVADKFYAALKAGNVEGGMRLVSPNFRKDVPQWPSLLALVQEKFGTVSSAEFKSASSSELQHSPCFKLSYAVKRASLMSDEALFVCRTQGGSDWSIEGHSVTRLDNMQSVLGGMMPTDAREPRR